MIEQVYQQFVKQDPSYFKKWEKVPPFPGKKESGGWNRNNGWKGHDFPRVWCILDFIEWTSQLNLKGNIGYTDPEDPELEFVIDKFHKHAHIPYPPYDLHEKIKIEEPLDFFLFSQTLEHLHNPQLAVGNIRSMIKKNGLVFTSVPTINIPHMTPIHFAGFTPMGLAMLFINNGFKPLKIGQWGNYHYIQRMFKDHRWPDIYDLADENGHVPNEERNCCQCWILAEAI